MDTESLLALDAVPVFAVAKYDGEDPWIPKDLWEQVEFTEQGDVGEEISAEAIAASEPDLIVKLQAYETFDQDRFNQLSRVAPVLYTDAEQTTWQDVLTSLGETQDLRDAAASKIAEFDDRVEASKADDPDFAGKTIVPFCSHGGGRFGQSLTAITKLAPDAVLGEGLAVSYSGGSGLSEDVAAWLAENNIPVE